MINDLRKAFTLAEILLVLGIIGLVGDFTIPSLIIETTKKTNIIKWRKTYADFSNVFQLMQLDMDSFYDDSSLLRQDETMMDMMIPYLKVSKRCKSGDDSCWPKGASLPQADFSGWDLPATLPSFQLANGVIMHNDNHTMGWIIVDVNGTKKPNTFGKDLFAMRFNFKLYKAYPFTEEFYGTCIPPSVGSEGRTNIIGIGCSEYYLFND